MRRWLILGLLISAVATARPLRAELAGMADDTAETAHGGPEHPTGEAAHGDPNILELKLPLAICTALVFATLFAILWRFAWGPLAKALDNREQYHEDTLSRAEQARAESERMLAEHRALLARANDDVRALIDEARRNAEHLSNDIVAKAQEEADAAKQRAERDILSARDQALADIWTRTADLAVNVAGRVLAREIGPDEQRRLLDRAISQLPTNGTKGRA